MNKTIFEQAKENLKYIVADPLIVKSDYNKGDLLNLLLNSDASYLENIITMLVGSLVVQGFSAQSIEDESDDLSLGNLILSIIEEMSNESN